MNYMVSHSAIDVAAEIRKRLPGVPVKKLHKLLYYSQAHHAATFDEALFTETISAWDMGPVVGQLWWIEKQHGVGVPAGEPEPLNEAELNTIGYVISRYGRLSGQDLERLTHNEAPWLAADVARKQTGEKSHKITVAALAEFFRDQAEQEESADPPLDPHEVASRLNGAGNRLDDHVSLDTRESLLARLE